jgi:hypothetical protein
MPPSVNVTATTNQWLASAWVDQVLRDNMFFGEILGNTKQWEGSQMVHPLTSADVKFFLIYGETPNYAIA